MDWFILRDDDYHRQESAADGLLRSEVFPGLWLDPQTLLGRKLATVLEALQVGIVNQGHAAFVKRLRERQSSPR